MRAAQINYDPCVYVQPSDLPDGGLQSLEANGLSAPLAAFLLEVLDFEEQPMMPFPGKCAGQLPSLVMPNPGTDISYCGVTKCDPYRCPLSVPWPSARSRSRQQHQDRSDTKCNTHCCL
jgi:hypothetical protein